MNRIIGIFDLARSGGSLGTLLILLEELGIQRRIHAAQSCEVVFIADAGQLFPTLSLESASTFRGKANLAVLAKVARAMSGIACCHEPGNIDADSLTRSGCIFWPDPERLMQGAHLYDSTAAIQSFFSRSGGIPRLSVKGELLAWAKLYLEEKSGGRLPVAVHLKNNPYVRGQSNAGFNAWKALFSCECCSDAHFFLLGDDEVDGSFHSMPNVTITRKDGIPLEGCLALIQASAMFMGMMSGPANMALFGETPYAIFKNPNHHAAEMAVEIGAADAYPFALANQRVLRIWDTPENLIGAFEVMTRQMVEKLCLN